MIGTRDTYRKVLTSLSDETGRKVQAAVDRYLVRQIDHETAVALIVALIARANARAAVWADYALAAELTIAAGRDVAPLGLSAPDDDPDRLGKGAVTLLAVLSDTRADLGGRGARFGRSEPLTTAQATRSTALADHPMVAGWTRDTSADPCELCTWWGRDGRVWPTSHPMPTHKGCTCSQAPTLTARAPKPVETHR